MTTKTIGRIALSVALTFGVAFPVLSQDGESKPKTVSIFWSQEMNAYDEVNFYAWINYSNVVVKNTVPNLRVGYAPSTEGALFIDNDNLGDYSSAMFFITSYQEGDDYPDAVIVWFGGSQPDDINIRLPKGYTAELFVNALETEEN